MSISFFKRVFGFDDNDAARIGEFGMLFDTLSREFSKLNDTEIKKITGFSGLIGKVSYADMDISADEKRKMHAIFVTELRVDDEQAALLVSILVEHRIQLFSIEDYFYSRLINEVCSDEDKMRLMRAMFSVAAADGAISQEEDAAIYTAAKSLHLTHRDFISVRKSFVDYLDVLKK